MVALSHSGSSSALLNASISVILVCESSNKALANSDLKISRIDFGSFSYSFPEAMVQRAVTN